MVSYESRALPQLQVEMGQVEVLLEHLELLLGQVQLLLEHLELLLGQVEGLLYDHEHDEVLFAVLLLAEAEAEFDAESQAEAHPFFHDKHQSMVRNIFQAAVDTIDKSTSYLSFSLTQNSTDDI